MMDMTKEDKIKLARFIILYMFTASVSLEVLATAWRIQEVILETWMVYFVNVAPIAAYIAALFLKRHVEKRAKEWGVD